MFVLRSIVFKSFIVLLLLASAGAQELKIAAASDLSAALQKGVAEMLQSFLKRARARLEKQ